MKYTYEEALVGAYKLLGIMKKEIVDIEAHTGMDVNLELKEFNLHRFVEDFREHPEQWVREESSEDLR